MTIIVASPRCQELSAFIMGLEDDPDCTVALARSGRAVLELAGRIEPALVIIDEGLPDHDQQELAMALLRRDASINTAFVSPHSEKRFHDLYEGLGVLMRIPAHPRAIDARTTLEALRGLSPGDAAVAS